MRLSKSTFMAWCRCPHTAWYRVNDAGRFDRYADARTETLLAVGNEIDMLARKAFPGGVLLGPGKCAETSAAIARREPVIFQGEFVSGDLIVLADVLAWNGRTGRYDLIEVKSSTGSSDRDEEYARDLAFQEHVLSASGVPIGAMHVMHLNANYERHGSLDLERLFAARDFGAKVAAVRPNLASMIEAAAAWINTEVAPQGPCRCVRLPRSKHCEMFAHINPIVPAYSVHDIARINGRKLETLVDAGILQLPDVPDDFPLSDKQRTQVRLAKTGIPEIDRAGIDAFMSAIAMPAAFLDFETHNAALPRFDGYRPYQQIPFQFSLHVLDRWDDRPRHDEFLHLETDEPDQAFIQALRTVLPETSAVIVWNKGFERSRLQEIALRHAEHAAFVEDVSGRLVDLADVFSSGLYAHPDFRGSYSVKVVLPVLVPTLSYKQLAIQDGSGAQVEWNNIVTGLYDKKKASATAAALRSYCRLDTLAMVEIAKVLKAID